MRQWYFSESCVAVQLLIRFMVSLFLVYFAEYFINQALVCLHYDLNHCIS